MSVFNVCRQIATSFLVGFVAYFSFLNGINLFAWHPPLMLIGFLLLMTEAILVFSNDYAFTQKLNKQNRLDFHGALQFSAGVFVGLGFISSYYSNIENDNEEPSYHSNVGYTTCILMAGAFCGGLLARFGGILKLPVPLIKIVHAFFGTLTYYLALNAICSGINSTWLQRYISVDTIYWLIAVVLLIGITTMYKSILGIFNRSKSLLSRKE